MIEALKELTQNDMLTIDAPEVKEFAEAEDFTVQSVKIYSQDEGEIVFLDLDGIHLVAHDFGGDPKYFVYELASTGTDEDMEDEGMSPVFKDNEPLPRKIWVGRNDREIGYRPKIGPVYELNVDRNDSPPDDEPSEIAVCEYRGKGEMTHILIEMLDTTLNVYQGFQVRESSILL